MKEKDLDLDELHQAVSAMMDDKPNDEPKKTDAPKRGVVKSTTPREVGVPRRDQNEPQQVTVRHAPKINIQPRRRGGVMDIVQPVVKTPEPPSVRPSREAPAVKPANNLVKPEPPKPVPITPLPEPPRPAAPPEVNDELLASINMRADVPKSNLGKLNTSAKGDESWPDPLDFHDFKDEPPKNPAPTMTASGNSPFVNTKVEKRPLGAFTAGTPAKPVEPEEDLQAMAESQPQQAVPAEPEAIPVEDASEPAPPEPRAPVPTPNQDLQNARQMTIPPQYKQSVKQPSEETRPVFDTNEYHPPLIPEHVPHHGSGKGWLIAVIILIVAIIAALIALMVIFDVIPI